MQGLSKVIRDERASLRSKSISKPQDDYESRALTQDEVNAELELRPQYHIGFRAPGGVVDHKPVHESIGMAALIQSDLHWSENITYSTLSFEQWEYMRGLLWPDDPSCLLFLENQANNHDFDNGVRWYEEYSNGYKYGMTQRSHFGDLQFLHSMATVNGEPAQTTKDGLMSWLEVMYKLACGNQGVAASNRLDVTFKGQFDNTTAPTGSATLGDLILGRTTGYKYPQIALRALGVCMHIISDSYAVGHTQRQLLNPEDLAPRDPSGYIQFKAGTTAHFGNILAFHNYTGQEKNRHAHYDQLIGELPIASDINSFNSILGAKDAIGQLTKFLNLYAAKAAWDEGGVQKFLADEVFALDSDVQPGNTNVDSGIYMCKESRLYGREKKYVAQLSSKEHRDEESYEIGLARKMERLEGGLAAHGDAIQPRWEKSTSHLKRLTVSPIMFKILLVIVCVIAAMALGAVVPRILSMRHR